MDHSQFGKLSALYVAEVLEEPLLTEFQLHLGECLKCRNEVAYWNRGLGAIEDIRRFIARQYAHRHRRWVIALVVAAFALGMLIRAAGMAAHLMWRASSAELLRAMAVLQS